MSTVLVIGAGDSYIGRAAVAHLVHLSSSCKITFLAVPPSPLVFTPDLCRVVPSISLSHGISSLSSNFDLVVVLGKESETAFGYNEGELLMDTLERRALEKGAPCSVIVCGEGASSLFGLDDEGDSSETISVHFGLVFHYGKG